MHISINISNYTTDKVVAVVSHGKYFVQTYLHRKNQGAKCKLLLYKRVKLKLKKNLSLYLVHYHSTLESKIQYNLVYICYASNTATR